MSYLPFTPSRQSRISYRTPANGVSPRFRFSPEKSARVECRPFFEAYIGDDFPSDLPIEIPLAGLSVETGKDHFSLYDDDEWGTLFPSDGFVRLGPNDRTFHVSLFHQLHCLDVIRVGYLTNRTHTFGHIQHCLRYLRQILICHADTTLEDDIPQFVDGSWTHAANGVGSVHRCKDWTVLRRWVADHPSLPLE